MFWKQYEVICFSLLFSHSLVPNCLLKSYFSQKNGIYSQPSYLANLALNKSLSDLCACPFFLLSRAGRYSPTTWQALCSNMINAFHFFSALMLWLFCECVFSLIWQREYLPELQFFTDTETIRTSKQEQNIIKWDFRYWCHWMLCSLQMTYYTLHLAAYTKKLLTLVLSFVFYFLLKYKQIRFKSTGSSVMAPLRPLLFMFWLYSMSLMLAILLMNDNFVLSFPSKLWPSLNPSPPHLSWPSVLNFV